MLHVCYNTKNQYFMRKRKILQFNPPLSKDKSTKRAPHKINKHQSGIVKLKRKKGKKNILITKQHRGTLNKKINEN